MTAVTSGKQVKGTSKAFNKDTDVARGHQGDRNAVTRAKAVAVGKGKGKGKGKAAPAVKLMSNGLPFDGRGVAKAENTVTAEGVKVNKAKVKAAGVQASTSANGHTRGSIYGHSITSVVRAMAYHGISKEGVRRVLVSFGLPSKEGMVRAQWGDGQRKANGLEPFHGEPAPLAAGELKALKAIAGE